jgi:hypothetical protein
MDENQVYDHLGGTDEVLERWEPVLEGIDNEYDRKVCATLLENQARAVLAEKQLLKEEALTPGATTVGQLGTFQKFAFPLVRRVYPELIANKIIGVQPMSGPVSQIFYLGHSRAGNIDGTYGEQAVYSKFNLTYRGEQAVQIGSRVEGPSGSQGSAAYGTGSGTGQFGAGPTFGQLVAGLSGPGLDLDDVLAGSETLDISSVIAGFAGGPSSTYGGRIASFPDTDTTYGWSVSAGEQLRTSGIPEISFHIQQQAVVADTRKMRALWTLEAAQDLKAYHNLDLERELTELLSKEVALEIDRELIEDLRQIAYGHNSSLGNWNQTKLVNANPNRFQDTGARDPNGNSGFAPSAFQYDLTDALLNQTNTPSSNVFVIDMTSTALTTDFAPQHVGHRYANILALLNFASQDIYRTTHRGPGTWLVTSPLMASFLESAAKLEGGVAKEDAPTNMGRKIEYKGKFAGKYDLYVDPLYPEDEIMMGYQGTGAMDTGFVYAPYIPLQQLPTITDPETFQPRKGILTRYGKAAITPQTRFYRILRIVGPAESSLLNPFARNTAFNLGSR